MAKQPCSWWPAAGETRSSKRHDKVPSGGEQTTGPYDEESCRLVRFVLREQNNEREPSPAKMGEGHGRREELGSAAPMDPPGYGERNGWTADHGTGEIRLGTGIRWPRVAVPWCPVAAKPISSDPAKRSSAERKSEGAILVARMAWTTQPAGAKGPQLGVRQDREGAAGLPCGYHPSTFGWPGLSTGSGAWGSGQRRGTAEYRCSTARGRAG
jgi:hypothetical protein